MPASNQLIDGATLRSEIGAGNLTWISSDPGTSSLPSNQILTWFDYKSYVNTTGTTQFSNNYCPTYQNMLDFRYSVTPTDIVPVTSFTLSTAGINAGRAARLAWTVNTDSTSIDYNCNVEILWFNNNVSGIWRSDLVDQNVGSRPSPNGQAGDLVSCSYRYKSKTFNTLGPQRTTSTITLTSGTVRD